MHRLIILSCLLLSACNCGGTKVSQRPPQLFADRLIAFPDICPGDTLTLDTKVSNIGGSPLDFATPRLEDGAPKSFRILATPTSLPAGGDGVISLSATGNGDGHLLTRLLLDTDDPNVATARFNVSAFSPPLNGRTIDQARREVHALCDNGQGQTDCNFLDFNHAPGDPNAELKIVSGSAAVLRTAQLINKGCGQLHIRELKLVVGIGGAASDASLFTITAPAGAMTLSGGASTPLTVSFQSPAGKNALPNVSLHILTDDPVNPELTLGLLAQADAPSLTVDPFTLAFYDATQSTPATHTFVVQNNGTADLTVSTVALDHADGWTLVVQGGAPPFTLTPGTTRTVSVTYAPKGGASKAVATVTASDGETGTVTCYGGAYPQLAVTPSPIDFGTVVTGAKGTERTVQIANAGNADLHISKIELAWNPGGGYAIKTAPPAPLTIASGQNASVVLRFDDNVLMRDDPAKLGVACDDPLAAANGGEATIDIKSSDDPNFPPVASVTVTGANKVGSVWTLDASSSTDPESTDTLTYAWTLKSQPQGSTAQLSSASGTKVTLTPDVPGPYRVSMTVSDQFGSSDTAGTVPVAQ